MLVTLKPIQLQLLLFFFKVQIHRTGDDVPFIYMFLRPDVSEDLRIIQCYCVTAVKLRQCLYYRVYTVRSFDTEYLIVYLDISLLDMYEVLFGIRLNTVAITVFRLIALSYDLSRKCPLQSEEDSSSVCK